MPIPTWFQWPIVILNLLLFWGKANGHFLFRKNHYGVEVIEIKAQSTLYWHLLSLQRFLLWNWSLKFSLDFFVLVASRIVRKCLQWLFLFRFWFWDRECLRKFGLVGDWYQKECSFGFCKFCFWLCFLRPRIGFFQKLWKHKDKKRSRFRFDLKILRRYRRKYWEQTGSFCSFYLLSYVRSF